MGPGQNQQSVVHPFIFLGRHQMTHLWHFVVQKSSQQPLRCVSDYLCVQDWSSILSESVYLSMWCQPLPLPGPAPCPMVPVICVTTGHFVSSLCQISPPPPHSASLTPLLIHLVTSLRPRTCKQLTQSRRKTVRLKIICSDDLWIKNMGGRQLCYISTSIPVILEFIQ